MKKKRVLVLASTFPRWPGDRVPDFVRSFCIRMAKFNEMHVVAPWYPGAKKNEEIEGVFVHRYQYFFSWGNIAYDGGIVSNVRRHPLKWFVVPFFCFFQMLLTVRLARRLKPDVVHAHWIIPQALIAILACYLAGYNPKAKVLCTCHGTDVLGFSGAVMAKLKVWITRHVFLTTVVSDPIKDSLAASGADISMCQVIPMGTDFDSLFFRRDETHRSEKAAAFVGRLVEQKGVRQLINAFCKVRESVPDAELYLVGEGPLGNFVAESVKQYGLQGCLHFCGFLGHEQVAAILSQCALSIAPSVSMEGFGLAIVESMGCQCAVIASDFKSARDLIEDGQTGYLFEAGNSDALAGKWVHALQHVEEAKRIGALARQSVAGRFGWEKTISQYLELYSQFRSGD